MDLQAYNNQRFQFTRDLTTWAAAYDLTTASFRMQVRANPTDTAVLLNFSSTPGSGDAIAYDPISHAMVATTSTARMSRLSGGDYYWDYGFTVAGGDFVRIDGGVLKVVDGVTRPAPLVAATPPTFWELIGGLQLSGFHSGTVIILPQNDAGTYNFNLPTSPGTAGQVLASGGGGLAPMTWASAAASGANTDITSLKGTIAISSSATAIGSLPVGISDDVLRLVGADGSRARLLIDGYGSPPNLTLRGSTGGAGAPSAISSGGVIGGIEFRGYGATAYSNALRAGIKAFASESWSDSAQGAYLVFEATPTGGTATLGVGAIGPGFLSLVGTISGVVTLNLQAAAGTYNFNLPNSAGSANQLLTSQGGGSAAMTWTPVGAANGVASLDSGGKVPTSQLPAAVLGALSYQGAWNANTNSPALASGVGSKGFYYKVSVTGSTAIDGISQWNAGDLIAFDGTTWDKIDGISSEVLSVAGRTGAVTLTHSDIGDTTFPASLSLVGTTDTQTLTNKTLTSPLGIVKGDVGLANVDNTSDATKNSASATLTNKNISGASNTLSNIGNSALTNSSITIAGHSVALGGSQALAVADITGAAASGANADITSLKGPVTVSSSATALGSLPAGLSDDVLRLVGTDGQFARLLIDGYGSPPTLTLRSAGGGASAPSALGSNGSIGTIGFRGYGATGYSAASRAGIKAFTLEAWSDAAQGAYLVFEATPTGGTATFGVGAIGPGFLSLVGITSGVVTLNLQAAAGTYNFNLPTTAGSAGQALTSQGGGSAAMTWATFVTGPGSAVNGNIPTFNGTTGALIQDSGKALPSGAIVGTTDAQAISGKTSYNKVAITAPATGSTLTIADGKTLTANNSVALSGTDGSTLNIGAGGTLAALAYSATINNANWSGTALALGNGGSGQTTALAARGSSGFNIESGTGHGDSTYTIVATDRWIYTNAAFTASRTWTLPAASAVNAGAMLIVDDLQGTVTATNTLVVSRAGSDTINGAPSFTIDVASGRLILVSDGTSKWTARLQRPYGTAAGQAIYLDSSAHLPAVDGSALTGLTKSQVSLANVDNTSDATKNSASATLTNKTIDTAGPNTIKVNGNTLSASAGTATVTLPNSTDTLVGRATTDTLTNKTYDTAGAGNVLKVSGVDISTAWTAYTPSVAPAAGSGLTTTSATGVYKQVGKRVDFQAEVVINANGTGAGSLNIGIPVTARSDSRTYVCIGNNNAGNLLQGLIAPGGTTVSVYTYNAGYPGGSGTTIHISGTYEAA